MKLKSKSIRYEAFISPYQLLLLRPLLSLCYYFFQLCHFRFFIFFAFCFIKVDCFITEQHMQTMHILYENSPFATMQSLILASLYKSLNYRTVARLFRKLDSDFVFHNLFVPLRNDDDGGEQVNDNSVLFGICKKNLSRIF